MIGDISIIRVGALTIIGCIHIRSDEYVTFVEFQRVIFNYMGVDQVVVNETLDLYAFFGV